MRAMAPRLVRGMLAILLLSAPAAAQQKPTLTPADYAKWETLGITEVSPDGRWIAYVVTRVDGDEELRYRAVAEDATRVVKHGSRPAFSGDGRWLAYSISVSADERDRLNRASQPVPLKAAVVDLRTGATTEIANVASFEFSGDGRFIALRPMTTATRKAKGSDLVVRDLATGSDMNFGNVAVHAWRDGSAQLAMVIDAENRAGNGVRLYDARTGVVRTLDSDSAEYTGLAWRRDADDLAVLRVRKDERYEEPAHSILAWLGLSRQRPSHMTFEPATRAAFPADQRIVEARELKWSDDGGTLFFGMREWTRKPGPQNPDSAAVAGAAVDTAAAVAGTDSAAAGVAGARPRRTRDDEPAGVEVWHSADVDIIPEQKFRAGLERSRSWLAAWHLDGDRFVQLADSAFPDVTLSDGRFAMGVDGRPYDSVRMFGPAYRNIYAVDVQTGERRRVADRVQYHAGPSPSGRYLLYVQDGHYWTYDTSTGRHTNITQGVPTSFMNLESDYTVEEKPPFGTGGWTTNDRSVLLHDKYDLWEVRPDGSRAVNLTNGAADGVRHRRVWLDPEHRIVDSSRPIYVTLYGDTTKQYGYGRVRPGSGVERLVFTDRNVSRLGKAKNAEVYFYRVEGFDRSPNWFVGGPRLADARQVTDTNPFQSEYAWGRSELVNFRNRQGQPLQAALHYPANWEPGRQYPMIVYFYEITSNTLHNYSVPSEHSAYNPTIFTQNGYFVLRPDIVYRGRDPGVSAVDALVPAVETMLGTGMIDRDRIGIIGHSWGAYQTAFAVTQTDLFSAAVAGAPLTNLISMYLSVFWNTGVPDARIFEIQQGRMEVPFWQDVDAYIRNSPVFHIENMNTPLLVAFGDKDGAVEFNQGVELYNAARRAGKEMVLLVYEGENHSLAKRPNQVDYHRRINEWFAHHLKGEPAADWITRGVPHQERQRELELLRRQAQ